MASIDLTAAQADRIKAQAALVQKMKAAGRPSTTLASHRQKSMRSIRWTMGRVDNKIFASSGLPFMQWWVNPSECQWKIATRTTIEKISGGIVHHEWPQTGHDTNPSLTTSRFDQPLLSFTFQTGIITPGGYNDLLSGSDTVSTAPPPGLGNFFDFLELLDRPDMVEDSTNPSYGQPNYVNMIYVTPIFGGRGIWLQGHFTEEGVSWTDSADDPNQIKSWGATFMVFNSQPSLSMLRQNFELIGIPAF